MPTYVDTSALLRAVERRGDLTAVAAALAAQPCTSILSELECSAALHRRWHTGSLSAAERDRLLAVAGDILAATDLLPLNDTVLAESRALVRRHPLRTLDALHLATAVEAERRLSRAGAGGLRFCTADHGQAAAARGQFGDHGVDLVPRAP